MGLLDDAIRDHLDLKRRRGADPTEVERAEREALGPVRRAPEEPGEIEFAPEQDHEREYVEDGPATVGEHDEDWDDPFAGEPDPDATAVHELPPEPPLEESRPRELYVEPPPPEPEPPAPQQSFLSEVPDAAEDDPAAPVRAPVDEPPSPDLLFDAGEETVEYDVEDALESEGDADDDVLEETPEFLQDTPDHDRLWFEQKPPRDFDFDG